MRIGHGFQHIGDIMPGVLKEISRRAELWLRLEAECGRQMMDEEFLKVAEATEVQL